jgi:hypothetical protein
MWLIIQGHRKAGDLSFRETINHRRLLTLRNVKSGRGQRAAGFIPAVRTAGINPAAR